MLWLVLGMVVVAFVIGWPMTALMVRAGHSLNALDSAGVAGHVKELRPIPNIGGVAIYTALALPLLLGLMLFQFASDDTIARLVPAIEPHVERIRETMPTAWAMLVGMTVLHVVGVVDDRRSLGAMPKLAAQLGVAAMMAIWFDIRLLSFVDSYFGIGPVFSIVMAMAWIVVITNAINFLDNMDGLAGGVCAIAAGLFMTATILNAQWFIAATLALLLGSLLAFLWFNFSPARIFMGDGGSLVVGFVLAILTARTTYYNPEIEGYVLGGGWYGVFMPVIVLAIPLYDCVSVTIIRLRQGRSPFVGDQQHFSHRLVERGLSKRNAVLVIWAATAVTGIGGISLGQLQPWQALLVGVQTLLVLGMLAMLELSQRRAT